MNLIRIATRNSPLALWQANYVKQQLMIEHPSLQVDIVAMTTQGDQMLDRRLSTVGGKGLFLKELEVSLLNNETDIAVHSMKDVPVVLPDGLEIPVVCERADPRDAVVSNDYQNLYALPNGSRVGTSSLRRISQLKNAFPTLEFVELRGNVNTRLAKLDNGDYDAIILAAAGLIRLGYVDRIKQYITPELCLPAVGQGIVGIECRSNDARVKELIAPLHDRESCLYLAAERTMNARMQGGCQVPIAGYAEITKGKIRMRGMVGDVNGSRILMSNMMSNDINYNSALELGEQVASDLLQQGAGSMLSSVYRHSEKSTLAEKEEVNKPVVILTRQDQYLGNTQSILESLDYVPVHIPTLGIKVMKDQSVLGMFACLDEFTDIVFVSRNAVETGMSLIGEKTGLPKHLRVMAVGAETAKQLYNYGVDAMFPDHDSGAEALLSVKQLADLSNRKILIVRGSKGLDWPAEEMVNRGAVVESVVCYQHILPSDSDSLLKQALQKYQKIDGVFVHSAQSADNLMTLMNKNMPPFKDTKMIAGSKRIAERLRDAGWDNEIRVAQSPSNKHMIICFSGS